MADPQQDNPQQHDDEQQEQQQDQQKDQKPGSGSDDKENAPDMGDPQTETPKQQ